jgi:hypothetical protein
MTSPVASTAASHAAIVTTLRDSAAVIESFVAYHRAIGFDHLFLFFDDPADPMLAWAQAQDGVTAIPQGDALRQAWSGLKRYDGNAAHVEREVMARQVLNVEHAMNLARAQGLKWLLHIDADELFHVPGGDAAAHFAWLETTAIETVSYANFEAVPEAEETGDFFRAVTLFKKPKLLRAPPLPEAKALIERTGQLAPNFFHFYDNGKSAVRLNAAGMLPKGVHSFVRPGKYASAQSPQQFILHYACCGFDAFWQKYRTLGRFADQWWNKYDIVASIGPFHLQARDAVMSGDVEHARRFYRERVMIDDAALVADLTRHNLLARIDEPAKILGAL